MSKIKIKVAIFSKDEKPYIENKLAIKRDNNITYYDNGSLISLLIKQNKVILRKNNKDIKLNLEFEKDKSLTGFYFIKDLNIKIKAKAKTKKLKINDNSIKIEYDLFMNDEFSDSFIYNIEWSDLK